MPRVLRGVARTAMIAGTATAVSGRVQRRQAQRFAERDAQAAPPPPAPPAPQPEGPAQADMISQLKQLGELHTQGILTDEEFAAQKAKLLGT